MLVLAEGYWAGQELIFFSIIVLNMALMFLAHKTKVGLYNWMSALGWMYLALNVADTPLRVLFGLMVIMQIALPFLKGKMI